jgi:biopolymer transport protein ExbB
MKHTILPTLALALVTATPGFSQEKSGGAADPRGMSYDSAAERVFEELEASLEELSRLREEQKAQILPLNMKVSELQRELSEAREEYQQSARLLDSRTLDLSRLQSDIKARREESAFISNLLVDYQQKFEARLHITEVARYEEAVEAAKLAPEDGSLEDVEVFERQAALVDLALGRAIELVGGAIFEGSAIDSRGLLQRGTVVLVGPTAIFASESGAVVGTAEARLGSLQPAALAFGLPEDTTAAAELATNGAGLLPLDPTLGNARLVEETQETFVEHVQKGGAVMIPIFVMAGLALLVALFKWLVLIFTPTPGNKRINELLNAVGAEDQEKIHENARRIRGPVGAMLTAGVEHLKEPQELIEEVMYERMLTTKLRLQSMLPFIAICAASAPLLGLLGTVTGIINTFKLITVFGSGDVKSLSGGISEALITTKFGLIVAIPSLLLHAFLSRKAKGITDQMEKAAVAFVNQVMRTRGSQRREGGGAPELQGGGGKADPELVREQVNEILKDILGPGAPESREGGGELAGTTRP